MKRKQVNDELAEMDVRDFDPLYPVNSSHISDCVLHMAVCFEPRKTHANFEHCVMNGRNLAELDHLKFNIDRFNLTEIKNSSNPNWQGDLIISINGFIHDGETLNYLRSIDGSDLKSGLKVKIFQRPNVGYQWGGFYDVWQRYKDATCQYYVSFEEDCFFSTGWFDRLVKEVQPDNIGCVGQLPCNKVRQIGIWNHVPAIFIRDGSNRHITLPIHIKNSEHTRGAFYFCKKSCLERLDTTFACFTHAMSNNHQIDGVFAGEIGFSQKLAACGYELKAINICQPQSVATNGIRTENV